MQLAVALLVSQPRQIIPGRFYLVTRRCTQRQFLLRPDPETNNAFLYCLAIAAERCRIEVICSVAESNHHHTVVFDRHGQISEFIENFHRLVAKSQNAYRGRWENFWASEEPCLTCLVDVETVIDKVIYALTNPVKDHLVDRVVHWPGVNTYSDLVAGRTIEVRRPRHFFRPGGPMPTAISLELQVPPELGERSEVIALVRARVEVFENAVRDERHRTGVRILGRRGVREQDWRDSPSSDEARRRLRPRFAGRLEARVKAIASYRAFLVDYRFARRQRQRGAEYLFPFGTYWLTRFTAAPVAASN